MRPEDRELLHRWFVRYNPLYFFSALCVLGGVFLVSRGLDEVGWREGKVFLTAVLETYQLLLIAAAALLYRVARQTRPAVLLGLLEAVFFLDCTLQTESLAALESRSLAAAWGLMAALKLAALAWAFRLRPAATAFLVPLLAAAALAATPQILDLENADRPAVHLLVTWLAAGLAALVLEVRPRMVSLRPLDPSGAAALQRLTAAVWGIWGGLFLLHLAAWTAIYGVPLTVSHAVPFLLLATLRARREIGVWAGAAAAMAVAAAAPAAAAPAALLAAVLFVLQARRLGQDRLYLGAVMALHLAIRTAGWQQGPPPEAGWALMLATAAALLLLAWHLRLPAALVPLPLGLYEIRHQLLGLGALELGSALLLIGFLALFAGVAVNWRARRRSAA